RVESTESFEVFDPDLGDRIANEGQMPEVSQASQMHQAGAIDSCIAEGERLQLSQVLQVSQPAIADLGPVQLQPLKPSEPSQLNHPPVSDGRVRQAEVFKLP